MPHPLTVTGWPCEVPERVKLTVIRETFLDSVRASVLNFCETIAVLISLPEVWLASEILPFTNTSDRLKYRAGVSRGTGKLPPARVS